MSFMVKRARLGGSWEVSGGWVTVLDIVFEKILTQGFEFEYTVRDVPNRMKLDCARSPAESGDMHGPWRSY